MKKLLFKFDYMVFNKNIKHFNLENCFIFTTVVCLKYIVVQEKFRFTNFFKFLDQGCYNNDVTNFLIQLLFVGKNGSLLFLPIFITSFVLLLLWFFKTFKTWFKYNRFSNDTCVIIFSLIPVFFILIYMQPC